MAGGNKRPLIDSFIGAINQSYSYITANWQNEDLLANCTSVYNAIKMPMLIFVTIPRSFWNWGACLLFSHLVWMFASRTSSGLVAGLLSHCIPAEPWMQVCEMVNSSFCFFFFLWCVFPNVLSVTADLITVLQSYSDFISCLISTRCDKLN